MSRTDKDRPYWVILNDKTILMRYEHNHPEFGSSGTNHWGKFKVSPDYCTAFEDLSWHSYDDRNYLPCRRWTLLDTGFGKLPPSYRHHKYRPHRRDFLKKQVKVFNSQCELHDDYDFMNDDVYEPFTSETSHSHWQK